MYADVNGLKMFYEIRGPSDPAKVPVVLLHGAISATGTSLIAAIPSRMRAPSRAQSPEASQPGYLRHAVPRWSSQSPASPRYPAARKK